MDPGLKVLIFIAGGALIVGSVVWVCKKLVRKPPHDPTSPTGLHEGSTGDYTPSGDD